MGEVFVWIEDLALAEALRTSRWGYAVLNATHILGIATLVGAITPLNLKLLGLWPSVPLRPLAQVLVPVAACGLALAIAAGLLLFSVRAQEYATVGFFQIKLTLVLLGALLAARMHLKYGMDLTAAPSVSRKAHGLASMACWLGALFSGRFIAFVVS